MGKFAHTLNFQFQINIDKFNSIEFSLYIFYFTSFSSPILVYNGTKCFLK